jgi:hypothetical protein
MRPKSKPFAKVQLFSRRPKPRGRTTPRQIATLRLHDLARLFRARWGITLPDDDAGREDMMTAVNHLASLKEPLKRIDDWLGLWCPWITLRERNTIAAEAMIHPQRWKADQLAWRLRLTYADRQALAITTIGAIDVPRRDRIKLRRYKAAHRAKWHKRRIRLANLAKRLSVTQHKSI